MDKSFKKITTIIGIYFVSFLFAYVLAPLGGMIHSTLLSVRCWGGVGSIGPINKGCEFEGFIYLFIYLLAIFSFSVLKQKTAWKVYIGGTFIFWIFSMWVIIDVDKFYLGRYIGSLIIMLSALALGYGTGIGIKALIKQLKKTK